MYLLYLQMLGQYLEKYFKVIYSDFKANHTTERLWDQTQARPQTGVL